MMLLLCFIDDSSWVKTWNRCEMGTGRVTGSSSPPPPLPTLPPRNTACPLGVSQLRAPCFRAFASSAPRVETNSAHCFCFSHPPISYYCFFFFNWEMILLGQGGGRGEEVSGSEELFCNRPPVLFNTHAAARRLQQPGTISSSLPCDWQQTVCHSVVAWQQQKTKPWHNVGFVCRVFFHRSVYIMYLFAVLAARPPPPELRKLDKPAWRASRGCVYTATVTGRGGYIVDN